MIDKFIKLLSNDCNICNRKDYFIFIFFNIFLLIITILVSGVLYEFNLEGLANLIIIIIPFILLISFILLSIKRLHDINYNGYWFFSILIFPLFLYLVFQPSVVSKNRYIPMIEDEEDKKLNELINKLEQEKTTENK